MRAEQGLLCVVQLLCVLRGENGGKSYVDIVIVTVYDTYFGAPALEFSTLLEVTEAVIMYIHTSCI